MDINAGKDTALINAVSQLNYNMVELLLKNGANVNAQNGKALEIALLAVSWKPQQSWRLVHLLLDYGADIHIGEDTILLSICRDGRYDPKYGTGGFQIPQLNFLFTRAELENRY